MLIVTLRRTTPGGLVSGGGASGAGMHRRPDGAIGRAAWCRPRDHVSRLRPAGLRAADRSEPLAEVGRRLRDVQVTFFVMADPIDYASAGKIIAAVASGKNGSAMTVAPTGKVIVAIQPVVVEPLGLAVTEGADAVVLCIEVGRTRLAAARRTIELVGRERIAGALLLT